MTAVFWIASVVTLTLAGQQPAASTIAAGRKIYESEKCFTCHQIAGQGNKVFPLDGVGSRLTAADIRRWFTHTAQMEAKLRRQPAIRMSSKKYRFNAAELDALVAYLQSLK
jgi:cbb3-type cytochrome oxidase cytochrome c subunit